jgi:hypothetical protein
MFTFVAEIFSELKKQFYISIFSIILFGSFVFLNNYSIQYTGSSSEKQNLEIRKFSNEKGSMKDVTDDNPRVTGNQSAKTILFEETAVQRELNITALFLDILLSDPTLFDLPPPHFKTY